MSEGAVALVVEPYPLAVAADIVSRSLPRLLALACEEFPKSALAVDSATRRTRARSYIGAALPLLAAGMCSLLVPGGDTEMLDAAKSRILADRAAAAAVLRAMAAILIERVQSRELLGALVLALDELRDFLRRGSDVSALRTPTRVRRQGYASMPLQAPVMGEDYRRRLQSKLRLASQERCTVLTAGAGFNLSSAAGHYLLVRRAPFVWLPARQYGAGVQQAFCDFAAQLGIPGKPSTALTQVRLHVATRAAPLVVVVEDAEQLAGGTIDGLCSCITAASGHVHWLILGQTRGALPWIHCLDEITPVWIHAADCCYGALDVLDYARSRDLEFSRSDAEAVIASTDGWPVAVDAELREWPREPDRIEDIPSATFIDENVLVGLTPEEEAVLKRSGTAPEWQPARGGAETAAAVDALRDKGYLIRDGDSERLLRPLARRLEQLRDAEASRFALSYDSRSPAACVVPDVEQAYGLDVQFLGELVVWRGGERIESDSWRKRKVRALFTILAMQRSRVHRDLLLEWLWPALDASAAQNNLKFTVHHLRRALEPDLERGTASRYIVYDLDHYCLRSAAVRTVDTEQFEQLVERGIREAAPEKAIPLLRAAAIHYKGEFAPEFRYDDWALRERERLCELWLIAQERLSTWLAASSQVDEAIVTCARALDVDPTRETLHQCLMSCYLQQGDRAAALRQYGRLRDVLMRDLRTVPNPTTESLIAQASLLPANVAATALTAH